MLTSNLSMSSFYLCCSRYSRGQLIEVNSQTLCSKWYSESGKLVHRLFDHILQQATDPKYTVVFIYPLKVQGSIPIEHIAKTLYRKCETNIPRNETAQPCSQFLHSFICERLWEYINLSQVHECGNWERGRAVSFLGTHKSDLVCSAE